jgi:hypothetical protein
VRRVPVQVGVHRDGRDPEFPAGSHHAQRDLATIRDEDLGRQRAPGLVRSWGEVAVSYG